MNGTPKYATCAQKSAIDSSRVEYIPVKASSQRPQAAVMPKNATLTREKRRTITRVPKASISSAVRNTGTAYAEKMYELESKIGTAFPVLLGRESTIVVSDPDFVEARCPLAVVRWPLFVGRWPLAVGRG